MTRTIGPWTLTVNKFPNGTYSTGPYIFAPNGPDMERHICELPRTEQGEANGQFIVLAANSHAALTAERDALLAAMQALFRECVMMHRYGGDACNQREADAAEALAHSAIALCEKGAK